MFNQSINGCSLWKTAILLSVGLLLSGVQAKAVDEADIIEDYHSIIDLCRDASDIGVHIFFPNAIRPDQPLMDLSKYNMTLSWANSGDGDGRGRGEALQVYCDEVTPETRDPDVVDPDEIEIY